MVSWPATVKVSVDDHARKYAESPLTQEGHHLVDQLLVLEQTRLKCDGDDVGLGRLLLRHGLSLLRDQVTTRGLDVIGCGPDVLVVLDGEVLDDPPRKEHAGEAEHSGGSARVQHPAVLLGQLVGGVLESVEVTVHAGDADDVQSCARNPAAGLDGAGSVLVCLGGGGLFRIAGGGGLLRLRGVLLRFDNQRLYQGARLVPEDRVEILDVAESKGREEVLALDPVLVALGEEDAHAEDAGQAVADLAGLDEFVALGHEQLLEDLGAGDEHAFVHPDRVPDEAVVLHGLDPVAGGHAGLLAEDAPGLAHDEVAIGRFREIPQRTEEARVDDGVPSHLAHDDGSEEDQGRQDDSDRILRRQLVHGEGGDGGNAEVVES